MKIVSHKDMGALERILDKYEWNHSTIGYFKIIESIIENIEYPEIKLPDIEKRRKFYGIRKKGDYFTKLKEILGKYPQYKL